MKIFTDQLDVLNNQMILAIKEEMLKHSGYKDILAYPVNNFELTGKIVMIKLIDDKIIFDFQKEPNVWDGITKKKNIEINLSYLKDICFNKGEVFDLLNYILDIV